MKVLLIAPRYPERDGRGDQLRAFVLVKHLAERHDVRVITGGTASTPQAEQRLREMVDVDMVHVSTTQRAAGAAVGLVRGMPGQVGWMCPRVFWRRASNAARDADVVLANTSRAIREPLASRVVLDHIDALSLNMRRRSAAYSFIPVRLAVLAESVLMRRWEERLATWVTSQVVTCSQDAVELPPEPAVRVIPHGYDGKVFLDPPGHVRDIDVIFTGNMRYPPNRLAAEWLCSEIAPLIRRKVPDADIWVVGRRAARLRVAGVKIASDVPDVGAYLRRAKVAVAPLTTGTGVPNKLLEAAANGAAVASTSWAAQRVGMQCLCADRADSLADLTAALLCDAAARENAVSAARAQAQGHLSHILLGRLDELLVELVEWDTAALVA
jgi:glycosyl transferase family 1